MILGVATFGHLPHRFTLPGGPTSLPTGPCAPCATGPRWAPWRRAFDVFITPKKCTGTCKHIYIYIERERDNKNAKLTSYSHSDRLHGLSFLGCQKSRNNRLVTSGAWRSPVSAAGHLNSESSKPRWWLEPGRGHSADICWWGSPWWTIEMKKEKKWEWWGWGWGWGWMMRTTWQHDNKLFMFFRVDDWDSVSAAALAFFLATAHPCLSIFRGGRQPGPSKGRDADLNPPGARTFAKWKIAESLAWLGHFVWILGTSSPSSWSLISRNSISTCFGSHYPLHIESHVQFGRSFPEFLWRQCGNPGGWNHSHLKLLQVDSRIHSVSSLAMEILPLGLIGK